LHAPGFHTSPAPKIWQHLVEFLQRGILQSSRLVTVSGESVCRRDPGATAAGDNGRAGTGGTRLFSGQLGTIKKLTGRVYHVTKIDIQHGSDTDKMAEPEPFAKRQIKDRRGYGAALRYK
jgi:hypothetical protein